MKSDDAFSDDAFMEAALRIAQKGQGRTRPNPAVGALIVSDGKVVAEGFTKPAGGDHAEIDALKNLSSEIDPKTCTMYVTLEPCSVQGRTPACTDAILASGISKIVVGTIDTNPEVSGNGVEILKQAGREVSVFTNDKACRKSNAAYFSVQERKRPWFVAKYAMTLDGKIATLEGDSKWITNEEARSHVGKLRNIYDAIMVGTETLIKDDPRLTARIKNARHPVRILVDRQQRVPLTAKALDGVATTLLFSESFTIDRKNELEKRNIICIEAPFPNEKLAFDFLNQILLENEIMSVLVEGGAQLLGSFFEAKLIDEVWAYIAPKILGGDGLSPFAGTTKTKISHALALVDVSIHTFETNVVIHGFTKEY